MTAELLLTGNQFPRGKSHTISEIHTARNWYMWLWCSPLPTNPTLLAVLVVAMFSPFVWRVNEIAAYSVILLSAAHRACIMLEMLKITTKLSDLTGLKTKLYVQALQVAFSAFRALQPVQLAAQGELVRKCGVKVKMRRAQ